ncbi:hypothetical protein LOAG_14996 [Loa loa]|uniref:Uncharacterized protein n=1 Tax=Loa loa TaxID=7209 RepID=A0A1S0TGQ4_LOALO|nr:hypothetical protein LOAG_14996 [Loa loa]EFO13532.1 hypothetical protein LOAG_14996 [Loa loa]
MQNCQPFTVATFRRNRMKLINVKSDIIFDGITNEWNYRINDAIHIQAFTSTIT